MQDNSFHFGSGHDRTQNVAEFMHGLHAVPRPNQCRDDQKKLVPSFHGFHHTADHFGRTINNLRVAPLQHGFTRGMHALPPPDVCNSSAFDLANRPDRFSWRVLILPLVDPGCGGATRRRGPFWVARVAPQHGFTGGLRSRPPPYVC